MLALRTLSLWLMFAVRPLMASGAAAEEPAGVAARVHQVAAARGAIPGAPRASDVCMRSLRARPMNPDDPHDTLAAIRGFHVTWLEWTYSSDPAFIRQVKELGVVFGAAASAGSYLGDAAVETWNVVDLENQRLVAPWMRRWLRPNPWGCANNPEFRAGHVRFVAASIRAGADVLQRDEPAQNQLAFRWGGCFCAFCLRAFPEWLRMHADPKVLKRLGVTDLTGFDYRDYLRAKGAPSGDAFQRWPGDELKAYFERFQIESTVAFNAWWRDELNRLAGRRVPVSCNNGVREWTDIERGFDYCLGELSEARARPEYLYEAMRRAAALGKAQTVTMPLRRGGEQETADWVWHTRQTIATVYATGGHIEMPWDTYLPTPDAQRYFGRPERYADLTAFVRGMAELLDGYEDAFAAGQGIEDARWPAAARPVRTIDASEEVYVFARALPGCEETRVAIHLVDWRDEPQAFRLSLRSGAFFGDRPLRVRLYTPLLPYSQAAHERAFDSRDYSGCVQSVAIAPDEAGRFSIPALTPWGILVVEPEGE